jgi:hypothetical protein
MYVHRPLSDETEQQNVANRQTAGLVGIVITLVLLIVGLFLVQQLRTSSMLEDCVMSGRSNCGATLASRH